MKVMLESTEQIVTLEKEGIALPIDPVSQARHEIGQARVWVGTTESGIPIQALIVRVAVENRHSQTEFERELTAKPAPAPTIQAFPLRMIL